VTVELIVGDHHSQIVAPKSVIKDLKTILSYENDVKARRLSGWRIPQYSYLIKDDGVFFSGLVSTVLKYLKVSNIEFTLTDLRAIKETPPLDDVAVRLKALRYSNPPINLRDYQFDAVLKGLERTRGLIYAATGAGKSIIMASLIIAWHKKTLILVDSKDLALQLREELTEILGEPVGLIGSGVFDERRVTVGMVQTLNVKRSGQKSKKILKFLESIEYLCMDECHHIQAVSWRKTIRACKNASIFHGFTATPFTSKVKCEDGETGDKNILLRAYIGPSIVKIKTKYLVEEGWLAEPSVKFIRNNLYWDRSPLAYADEYTRILVEDDDRNRIICKVIDKAYREGKQVIGFISRLDHGEVISKKLISEFGVDPDHIAFVTGELDSSIRKGQLKSFKDGNLPILLGTVLNEGLNFFCDVGINIAGGDSIKSTIQRLGRVLRKAKDPETGDIVRHQKSHVDYYELTDSGHPYFERHSDNRFNIYKEEGHSVTIINEEDI
jgi:superfamily II DNA or RNA helicase